MKKLFVSCPMIGRTKEQILKSMKIGRKIAELYFVIYLQLQHPSNKKSDDYVLRKRTEED